MSLMPPQEVDALVARLSALPVEQVMAVFERTAARRAIAAHAAEVATLVRMALTADEQVERLSGGPTRVHEALEDAFTDLRIRTEARRAVLDIPMLRSSAVAEALGLSGVNTREAASGLRRRGVLLGVAPSASTGSYLYPSFQLDPVERRVIPVVATVNRHLGAVDDPWGVASWWVSPHPRLGGAAPMDLVATAGADDLLVLAGVSAAPAG